MKSESGMIALFVVLGIPAPMSLFSWLGSLISLANISKMGSNAVILLALITMLLAGTYVITYAISLYMTIQNKELKFCSFAPIIHIALFFVFAFLWGYAERLA